MVPAVGLVVFYVWPVATLLRRVVHAGTIGRTFHDVPRGGLLAYVDSHGPVSLAVNGTTAYVSTGDGIMVLDCSNPRDIAMKAVIPVGADANALQF